MIVAELLDAELHHQGMCNPCCCLDASHIWEVWIDFYEQIPEVQSISLALKDEFEHWSRRSWQSVTGDREGSQCHCIVMLRLLNLPNALLWCTCCLEWWDHCNLWEVSVYNFIRLTKICLLQEGDQKISGMYIFPMLQLRADLLILIWKASLETCLLSWSIIFKSEMLDQGWLLEMMFF